MYVCPIVTTCHVTVKNCSNMFVSALWIFLMVLLSGSINGLYQMFEILLSSYFGLDHAGSFEIIHGQIENSEFV